MKKVLLILWMTGTLGAMAQRIQNFYGFSSGASVGLRFTITAGPVCSGYVIYRSIDSVNYIQLYNWTSSCGDPNNNQEINYTDAGPQPNQTNYYKVELSSPYEVSPIVRVYAGAAATQAHMQLYPNPITNTYDLLNIRVFNTTNTRFVGYLYNQYGKAIRDYDLTTKLDLTSIGVYDLDNGLYVLWLTDGTQLYRSKFIINR